MKKLIKGLKKWRLIRRNIRICRMYYKRPDLSLRDIGAKFHMSHTMVWLIVNNPLYNERIRQ